MNICCRQPHFAFHQLLVLRPGSTNLRESFAALVAGKLSMVYGLVKQWNWWTDKTSTQPMESWAAHYCTLSLMNQDLSADWSVRTWSFVIFIDSQQSTHVSTDTFFLRLIFRRTIRTALASCATWLKLCRRGTALFCGDSSNAAYFTRVLLPRQTCGFASCLQAKVRKPKMLRKWCWCSAFQRASAGSFVQLENHGVRVSKHFRTMCAQKQT